MNIDMNALQTNLGYQATALFSLASSGKIDFKTAVAGLEAIIEICDLNRNIIAKDGGKIDTMPAAKLSIDESNAIYKMCIRARDGYNHE